MKEIRLTKEIRNGNVYNAYVTSKRNGKDKVTTILNLSKKADTFKVDGLTATGKAKLEKMCSVCTVSATLKLFSLSGTPFAYRLYQNAVRMFRTEIDGNPTITSFIEKLALWDADVNARFINMTEHKTVVHNFSMELFGEKKVRVLDVWEENVLTEKGKESAKFDMANGYIDTDVYDLYMACYTAMSELVYNGVVTSFFELWNYRQYGYKAITAVVWENRKYWNMSTIDNETDSYMNFDDSEDLSVNTKTVATNYFDRTFSSLENDSVKESVVAYLSKNLEKRKNRNTTVISEMFDMFYFKNVSQEEIGKVYGLTQQAVSKNIDMCNTLLLSPHGLNFLWKSCIISDSTYQKFLELDKKANG